MIGVGSQQSVLGDSQTLIPLINKDLPALDAFKFQDAVLEPWVVLQFLSYLFFVFGIDD